MDLKLRAVPQEVYGVMELNEHFNFQWNPDPASSLIGLGTSYVLEFFEFYGEKIGDYYDEFIEGAPQKDERFALFVTQEKRHAAAHRKLNNFITKGITPPVREQYHPRVYDFLYGAYKELAEPIIGGIEREKFAGKKSDGAFFKEAVRSIGIFESQVCMTGLSFFDNLFDNGRFDVVTKMSGNLGVLYLLGYHYTEEMEHCCISIEAFETIYQEKLWTRELVDKHIHNRDLLASQVLLSTLHVAKMLNQDLTVEQIINSVGYQYRERMAKKYIVEGFNAREPEILARRKALVERWDNEWEPMLLDKIKQRIRAGTMS